jgi:DNA polymerase (family X)
VTLLSKRPAVQRIDPAGSIRRRLETIGDIDILAASDRPTEVMDAFVSLPMVQEVLAKGPTKSSVLTQADLQIDLRVIEPQQYGSALQYFTGSKSHNIALRDLAIRQGYKLSEYGLFEVSSGRVVASETEEEIYRALGLEPVPPEMRENRGEIEAAAQGKLPKVIELGNIRGDLQVHSDWSDGKNSLQAMVEACIRRGYEYVAITDHSKSLKVANGLTPERVRQQRQQIDALNARYAPFRVLQGAEVNVHSDGSLDYDDETLRLLDFVAASIHGGFGQPREKLTARIASALRHPLVDMLCHPSGRLIGRREAYDVDMEAVIHVAAEEGKALEIDAQPDRLDLDDVWARRAKEAGVTLAIDSDAHDAAQLEYVRYGVYVARRAWIEPRDVLNARPLSELLRWLHRTKRAA